MTHLIHVPIEPLTERYTEQWYRHFPAAFAKAGFDVTVLDGIPLEDEIKVGSFLDINSTTHYKWSQLQQLSKMFHQKSIPDGTIIFFADIEFWGMEAIRLLADMNGVKVKLAGFLHAASYTREDAFSIAAPYQQYTEVGWIAALDMVFVGSEYHKQAVIDRRLNPLGAGHLSNRIVASGNPLFKDEYPVFDVSKENMVVLTNRFDSEKRPNETLALFESAKARFPDWRFLVCTGRSQFRSNDPTLVDLARDLESRGVIEIHAGLTKGQYHEILARAKVMVSHSIEENFGYCIAESLQYDCIPFLRRGLSHTELVGGDDKFLFGPEDDQLEKLAYLMSDEVHQEFRSSGISKTLLQKYHSALDNITDHLKQL